MDKDYTTYTVNSFKEYQDIILTMPTDELILYRGQPIDKTLLPKIARYDVTDVEKVEREMIADFQRRSLHLMNKHPDRKSTRLNSSHVKISYAVFCLKNK